MNAPQKTSACAPQSRVSDGVHLDKQETGAQSVIFDSLCKYDLVIVRMPGHHGAVIVRAQIRSLDSDAETCSLKLGDGACDAIWRGASGVWEYGLGDDVMDVPAASVMRKAQLFEWGDHECGAASIIYHALVFMAAVQIDSDFKSNAPYAAEKPWKHMQEAWLGGCPGLEAANG